MKPIPLLVMLVMLVASCAPSRTIDRIPTREVVELGQYFTGMEGSFLVLDVARSRELVYNPERARTRYLPASTFKIPNSLIALETGLIDGPDYVMAWDSVASPRQAFWPAMWTQNHTLRTAIQHSVVWYYQELARRTGTERMNRYLRQFDYGNQDISGGIDQFWLRGGLRISAEEQVAFLRRFYEGKLGLSSRTTDAVKEIIVLEENSAYRLSGKTGTAELTPTRELGWLVGYLEQGDDVLYYALNIEGERVFEDYPPANRKALVLRLLDELHLLRR